MLKPVAVAHLPWTSRGREREGGGGACAALFLPFLLCVVRRPLSPFVKARDGRRSVSFPFLLRHERNQPFVNEKALAAGQARRTSNNAVLLLPPYGLPRSALGNGWTVDRGRSWRNHRSLQIGDQARQHISKKPGKGTETSNKIHPPPIHLPPRAYPPPFRSYPARRGTGREVTCLCVDVSDGVW